MRALDIYLFIIIWARSYYIISQMESIRQYYYKLLLSIIYSDKDADLYETNLMRRLAGLLYIDNKTMGDIKEKIKKKL